MKDRQYKCPVCGAPVDGEKCEYCGCVIYDFANISTDEPRCIRLKIKNPSDGRQYILQMKAIAVNPNVEITFDEVDAMDLCGRSIARFVQSSTCTISVDLKAIEDQGRLFTLIDAERPYRESWRDDVEAR